MSYHRSNCCCQDDCPTGLCCDYSQSLCIPGLTMEQCYNVTANHFKFVPTEPNCQEGFFPAGSFRDVCTRFHECGACTADMIFSFSNLNVQTFSCDITFSSLILRVWHRWGDYNRYEATPHDIGDPEFNSGFTYNISIASLPGFSCPITEDEVVITNEHVLTGTDYYCEPRNDPTGSYNIYTIPIYFEVAGSPIGFIKIESDPVRWNEDNPYLCPTTDDFNILTPVIFNPSYSITYDSAAVIINTY